MNYASSSSTSSTVEDKVIQMESELPTVKNQINTLLVYIALRKDVPKHFVAMTANLVHASNNEVLILSPQALMRNNYPKILKFTGVIHNLPYQS